MKLLSWNVNGLRSILEKGLGAWLRAEQADVFAFQEIKATAKDLAGWQIPDGYSAWWNPAERRGYSGTLVLTRLPVIQYSAGIGEPEGDAEGRCQTLELDSCFVVNVYTPNARSDLSRLSYRTKVWDPAFREHCLRLARRKPVLFCGDLNVAHREIDLANPKTNTRNAGFTAEEREAFDAHLQAGFIDTFRQLHPEPHQYTWWSYRAGARARNVGWRIDYVCLSAGAADRLAEAFIQPSVMGSDHCPVGAVLRF